MFAMTQQQDAFLPPLVVADLAMQERVEERENTWTHIFAPKRGWAIGGPNASDMAVNAADDLLARAREDLESLKVGRAIELIQTKTDGSSSSEPGHCSGSLPRLREVSKLPQKQPTFTKRA